MADDFFADLLPMKPKSDTHAVENGSGNRSPFGEDAVLSAGADAPHGNKRTQVPDLLSPEPPHSQTGTPTSPMLAPMGGSQSSKAQKEVREFEAAVESTMRRFAGSLQHILEDINRRLESLENQTERLGRAISDARDVDCVREEGLKERFNSLDKGLRDISRGVQLVRDKQELIEAHAELSKLAIKKSEEGPLAPTPSPAPSLQEPVAASTQPPPAPVPTPAPVVETPKPPAPVAAPMPEPTVPPMPQTPTYSAPPSQDPQKQYSAQQPQYSAPLPPAPPAQPTPQYSAPPPPAQPPQPPKPQEPQQFQSQQQYPTQPQQQLSQQPPQQQPQQPPQYSSAPPQQPQVQAPPPYSAPPQQPPQQPQYSATPPAPIQTPPQQYSMPSQQPPKYSGPPPQAPTVSGYGGSQFSGGAPPPPPPHDVGPTPFIVSSGYGPPPPRSNTGYPQLPQPSLPNAPPTPQRYSSGGLPPPPPPTAGGYGYAQQGRPGGGAPPPPSHTYGGPVPRRHEGPPPSSPGSQTTSRSMPLEQVIDDVANMGFSRHDVRGVVSELMDKGQAVDLNIVLDRLMNGPRR